MNTNRFKFIGQGALEQPDERHWSQLNQRLLAPLDDPEKYYIADPGLVEAVNTALLLGMPLLLTGDPGVGKTQLAYRVAYELGCDTIAFSVKSGSTAQDLFYNIDHLRRLHAAQIAKQQDQADEVDVRHFIRFQGLGLAILRAMPETALAKLDLLKHAWDAEKPEPRQPSVVLIDEIDKAPLDFCNDMLEEIRRLQFLIPELSAQPLSIYADPAKPSEAERKYRPQIIITSNSEKGLPEAFLRRCIYHHIEPPSPEQLKTIVQQRLGESGSVPIKLDETTKQRSIEFFGYLADKKTCQLEKPPSTAELLNWLLALDEQNVCYQPREADNPTWQRLAKSCLLKHKDDAAQFERYYQAWRKQK